MATIPDGFISLVVAGDLYPFPPRSRPWLDEAGWVRMCWLDAGCIIVIQPGYSQVLNVTPRAAVEVW